MFMPMYDVTIQATYCDIPADDFTLMIRGGSGSGNYTAGTYIDIQSGSAPDGMVFDKWTGQIANVENINQSSTRIYMPTSNATVVATFKDIDSPESSSGGGGG